jgi:GNAT superfamily N-acetyltransferase
MFQPASAEDIAGILPLMRAFYDADGYSFDREVARSALTALARDSRLGRLWVVRDAGGVVAYLAVTFGFSLEFGGRDAFVDELVVAPSHQGRGLGTQALALAEAACRAEGIRALHLEVEFAKDRARLLYEKAGYVSHSRYLLTKRLQANPEGGP